ncbi:MAG: glycosyltransferase [Geobacter sp.]|nr:glycosyltransferase [Geobacter sp.]
MFETLTTDLKRLNPSRRPLLRSMVSGLLSQGFQAILVYRLFNWLHKRGFSGQPFRFVCERFIEITTGISIPACCSIGAGFRIHHFGGIIFHPTVVLGDNCTVYHGVTIGDRGESGNAARIGDNVLIGAGAKIIGEIVIGNNCTIGANAVVTKSMPANTVAIGSPCLFKPQVDSVAVQPEPASPVPRIMDFRGTYKGGGGPDKTVLNSAAQHNPDKVFVMVVYLRQPSDHAFQIPEMARRLGINYTDIPDRSMVDFSCLRQLGTIIRHHRLQVIHTHDDKTLLYAWILSLMLPGLKIMHTCHSHAICRREDFNSLRGYLGFRLRRRILAFLMQRHHKPIITVSGDTRQRLVSSGLPGSEIAVLHNGIDLSVWRPENAEPVLKREFQIMPDEFLVGTVARITSEKDLPTFYEVAEAVAAGAPKVRFVIVGDGYGDELQKARHEVARRGLSDLVLFTGHRSDLLNIYASLDIFLMTSVTEGMPNTLLEAMAMGIPSVSTSVGGIPELLKQGSGGFLSPPGDVTGLARHVLDLLSDPALREASGIACRKQVSASFSFSHRVQRMEEYYAWFAGLSQLPPEHEQFQQGDTYA